MRQASYQRSEPENVVVAETLPESVEGSEPVEEAVDDEQPSPMSRMQLLDAVALDDVAPAESIAEALTESLAVAEPLEESVAEAQAKGEPEGLVVADKLEEPVAMDDALSMLLVQSSPRPRIQMPLEVALAYGQA